MGLYIKELPYLPDFNRLITTLLNAVESKVEDVESSEYLDFLLQLNIIEERNGSYYFTKEWVFLANFDCDSVKQMLWEKLESVDNLLDIVRYIGTDGMDYDTIVSGLSASFSEQTVRTVLSWMENLGVVRIEKGKYYYNDRIEEMDDDSSEDSIEDDELDEIDVKDTHFSFFEYLRKILDGQIVLNPDFQRNKVWKNIQKSQFIESAILGLPLPPVYFKKDGQSKLVIVDGLQRTTAIQEFMGNHIRLEGLSTLHKLNGMTFSEMKESAEFANYATRLEDTQLFCYILQKSVPMAVVYDIFNRINTGGTKLSRQEIRNCLFIGHSTELLKRLSEHDSFRKAIDNGISKDRMKDRESILRCLAFQLMDYQSDYTGTMDSFLEKAMKILNKMSDIQIRDTEREFLKNMESLTKVFGNKNFRIYDDYTRGRINIAVMETVYWCYFNLSKGRRIIDSEILKENYANLIKDKIYLNGVRNSTGSKSKVMDRFRKASEYLMKS